MQSSINVSAVVAGASVWGHTCAGDTVDADADQGGHGHDVAIRVLRSPIQRIYPDSDLVKGPGKQAEFPIVCHLQLCLLVRVSAPSEYTTVHCLTYILRSTFYIHHDCRAL